MLDRKLPISNQTILPREILKWLGTLELTLPIKVPRRSFANGYIIGEILYKYYPKEVPIHGLESGSGKRCRVSNWTLLEKILDKTGIHVSRNAIEKTIEEIPGAAEEILQRIYEHVMKKSHSQITFSKDSVHDSNTLVRVAASLKPKSGAQVVNTGAASVILSLEEVSKRVILLWELIYSVTNIGDWDLVGQDESIYNLSIIMEKLNRKNSEITFSFQTDSRSNIVQFFSFLFKPFQSNVNSFPFRLSIKLFLHLIPLLCQSQPNAGTILLEALDAYSPVMKIPSLELKLGYLARIFGMVMETSELSILNFFQGALPPDVLVFFLAGLNYYIHTDYWFNQVQCLVLTLMEGNPTINSNQLHCGILVLIAALASPPWLIYTSTMEVFMSKLLSEVNQEKADSKVYCLAEVACVMLSEKIQSPASWYPCIWAARQLRDSSMLLCLIQNLFSLLTQHSCLTGTLLRFMSALPSEVLATVLRCEVTVQSVPYLLPKRIGPWSNLLRNSNELCEKLTMGLVVVANQIEFSILLPLIPFLITDNWTTNVMLLNTAWISLLENVDSHGWSLLQLICIKIPATHAMDKSLLFGMIATLSHHMRHRPSSVWLKTAIKDIVHTTLPVQNLWHALCHRINELWPKILPHYDLNQWAKLLQDPPKSNLITPEPNREAF